MIVRPSPAHRAAWLAMRTALWPDGDGLAAGIDAMLADPEGDLAAFLALDAAGDPIAFAEAALRRDYVEGCDTSPLAFVEGLYVMPDHRRAGIARALVAAVERWGRARGCSELASNALLDNRASHAFHQAIGFAETERVVFFRREIA